MQKEERKENQAEGTKENKHGEETKQAQAVHGGWTWDNTRDSLQKGAEALLTLNASCSSSSNAA